MPAAYVDVFMPTYEPRPQHIREALRSLVTQNHRYWRLLIQDDASSINVREMIEYFAPRGAIAYIHFRDVQGTVPNFTECFIGDGNYDPAEVMVLLAKNGFDGFLLDDHVPKMDGDSDWNHRGPAYSRWRGHGRDGSSR